MQLTTEEQERTAYTANNQPLAVAWGRVIDLENQACELRALVREAVDEIDDACERARLLEALDKMDDA
jgi:hypothetical protein